MIHLILWLMYLGKKCADTWQELSVAEISEGKFPWLGKAR